MGAPRPEPVYAEGAEELWHQATTVRRIWTLMSCRARPQAEPIRAADGGPGPINVHRARPPPLGSRDGAYICW